MAGEGGADEEEEMRLVAYDEGGIRQIGVLLGEEVAALGALEEFYAGLPNSLAAASEPAGARLPLASLRLAPPVPLGARVLCVGVNYRSHAEESAAALPEMPNIFARWGSTLVGDGSSVPLPPGEPRLDWEGELAAILGAPLYGAGEADVEAAILGYTCFNDLSARGHQKATSQWTLGKNADRSGPIGPVVVTSDEVGDPYDLELTTRVNGAVMQHARTSEMIFRVPRVVAYAAEVMSLRPGDVIATGTPEGVGHTRRPPLFLGNGDRVEIEIERIGVLHTTIS